MQEAASQLLRAIRGKRSQLAFSRWLGYRGNPAAKWEAKKRFPCFGEVLRAASRVGVDVQSALHQFHAPSAHAYDLNHPTDIAPWLRAQLGSTTQTLIAKKAGLSRQQVVRLLSGRSKGRAPQVMQLIDAMTGRLPDLVAALVDIELVPSLAQHSKTREALARLAFAHPWSSAAQAWFGARGKVAARGAVTELAAGLCLSTEHAAVLLDALLDAAVVTKTGAYLYPAPPSTVEVQATKQELINLRAHWAKTTAERVAAPDDDLFSFNVFAASRADVDRIRMAQRRFYREVRAIVADSPPEVVMLLTAHTGVLGS